jgi:hypothetical protein
LVEYGRIALMVFCACEPSPKGGSGQQFRMSSLASADRKPSSAGELDNWLLR